MDWQLEVVIVPVSDLDRAKRFYSEQVGFAVDYDTQATDEICNVQLTPPGSACSIALSTLNVTPTGAVEAPPGSAQGLQLVVSDVQAARAELVQRLTAARHRRALQVVALHGHRLVHHGSAPRSIGREVRWCSYGSAFTKPPASYQ